MRPVAAGGVLHDGGHECGFWPSTGGGGVRRCCWCRRARDAGGGRCMFLVWALVYFSYGLCRSSEGSGTGVFDAGVRAGSWGAPVFGVAGAGGVGSRGQGGEDPPGDVAQLLCGVAVCGRAVGRRRPCVAPLDCGVGGRAGRGLRRRSAPYLGSDRVGDGGGGVDLPAGGQRRRRDCVRH